MMKTVVVALVGMLLVSGLCAASDGASKAKSPLETSLVRVVDLDVGESQEVVLCNGKKVAVKLLDLQETRDSVRDAVRRAEVTVEVAKILDPADKSRPFHRRQLVSATYNLPTKLGGVQIDCSITRGYYSNSNSDAWGLEKAARLRLWPADSPLVEPDDFVYPVKQRWFATGTQMANEPTYVDGVEKPSVRKIYYHSGEDIGGAEGMVEVVAATDGLVVSSGLNVLEGHHGRKDDTPVAERYDVVYLLDGRGWYYRYSHLFEIDRQIVPGRAIKKGDRIGLLGKEGSSGGWSHLHFEIKSRQPSGKWGTQAAYAFLWEAYKRQYQPQIQAVARPHHLIFAGETIELNALKSWSAAGGGADFTWQFSDWSVARGGTVSRTYNRTGCYSEVLKMTDAAGRVDYDFAVVQVIDRDHPERHPASIHAVYAPTFGIRPGDVVTFKARTFGTTHGNEVWNFGDGTRPVESQSDGNVKALAKDGYAIVTHRYEKPGHYLVRVERTNEHGQPAIAHVHVRVGEEK